MSRQRTFTIQIVCAISFIGSTVLQSRSVAQAPLFDTSGFAPGVEAGKSKTSSLPLKPDGASGAEAAFEKPDVETLKSRVVSFNLLVKNARNPEEKAKFLIGRCLLHMQKAQYINALPVDEKSPVEDEELREAYAAATNDATLALQEKAVSKGTKSYAYYLLGLAQLGSNKRKDAIKSLESSLKEFPRATYAGNIVIFISDLHYEREDYLKSVLFLNQNMSILREPQKILAQYKIALAYGEMKEFPMAEETLLNLLKKSTLGEMAPTIVKELAVVSARIRNESGLISLASQVFPLDSERRAEFLSSAYSHLQRQQPKTNHGTIFQSLMNLASAPEKRVRLWLDEIRNTRQNYASRRPLANFQSISLEFGRMKEAETTAILASLGEALNLECDFLIRSYVDTFTGKTPNKEGLSSLEMTSSLQSFFKFTEKNFPNAKNRQQMFGMWLGVCSEQNDQLCVRNVSQKILAEPGLKGIHAQAIDAKILALKVLQSKDRTTYMPELKSSLEEYVQNPNASKWIEFAGYLADVYILEKKFDRALQLLAKANSIDHSENSFFRLQSARFLAGQYKDVVNDKIPDGTPSSPRLAALVREASLKLAAEAGDSDKNFGDYEANINRFLSLNADEGKSKAVLDDYIQRLIDKNEIQKAYLKAKDLDVGKRRSLSPTLQKLSLRLMQEGYFSQAKQLLYDGNTLLSPAALNEALFSRIGAGEPVSPKELVNLGGTERNYLIGVLALTRPKIVVQLMKLNLPLSKVDRTLGFLANKIDQNTETPSVDDKQGRTMASLAPKESASLTAFKKLSAQIDFPAPEAGGTEASAKLAKAVGAVRKLRAQVTPSLSGQTPINQVEVLRIAIRIEEQAAAAIEKSPVPANFAGEQKLKYLQKLNSLANEFRDQGKELRKILSSLDSSGELSAASADSKGQMPLINLTLWPWPPHPLQERLVRMVQEGNRAGAIIMLDLNRAAKNTGNAGKPLSDTEYYQFRTGVLLAGSDNRPLANFVQKELRSQNQMDILKTWREL